jgi:hypothetical protein
MLLMKRTPFSSAHSAVNPAGHSRSALVKAAGAHRGDTQGMQRRQDRSTVMQQLQLQLQQ